MTRHILVRWADANAPAGNPSDAPKPIVWPDGGWQIKPDLVVDGPTYNVPPTGVVEWTWFIIPGNFKQDTWVTSVEVKPSEPQRPMASTTISPSSPSADSDYRFRGSSPGKPGRGRPVRRRGKSTSPAWTGERAVALGDPCDSLQIVSATSYVGRQWQQQRRRRSYACEADLQPSLLTPLTGRRVQARPASCPVLASRAGAARAQ